MKKLLYAAAFFALGCADSVDEQFTEKESNGGFTFEDDREEPRTQEQESDSLLGTTWVTEQIGDAVSSQDWWYFSEGDEFRRSVVRSRFENSMSLEKFSGSWSQDGETVHLASRSLSTEFEWRFTSYANEHTLFTSAYVETQPGRYRRTSRFLENGDGVFTDSDLTVELAFDRDPFSSPTCVMTVTIELALSVYAGDRAATAIETFEFACSSKTDDAGAPYVSADMAQSWSDLFETNGIWNRYPAFMSNALYRSFRPFLYLANDGRILFERGSRFERQRTDHEIPERPEDVILDL